MKKILIAILGAAILLAVAGCAVSEADEGTSSISDSADETSAGEVQTDGPMDEEAAGETISRLMNDRNYIEYVVFRAGLNYDSEKTITIDEMYFAPVDDFADTAEIIAYLENTFTERFIQSTYYMDMFEGDYKMYIDYEGGLYMNVSGGGGGGEEYAYDNMEITELSAEKITAVIPGQDLYESLITANVTLVNTDGRWLIDELTVEYEQ